MARQTSITAYNQIKSDGLLSELRWIVYDCLFHHGPMTQGETWEHVRKYRKMNSSGCITSRFAELKLREVITETNQRPCKITGRTCLEWDVTSNIPSKIEPRLSNKDRITLLEKELALVKAENSRLRALDSTVFHISNNQNQTYFPFGR